jgi:signal transduction histidine kinase
VLDNHNPIESFEEAKARLAAVADLVPAGILVVDRDGRVALANERAAQLFGQRPDHVPDAWPIERALETAEFIVNERVELLRPDGSTIALVAAARPIVDAENRVVGAIGVVQDITAREQDQRVERDFVANAAHQLQSPLAGIISAIEVLQAGAKEGQERDVFLGHIERESNRLARLARALLILARAQSGLEAPKNEIVALEPLLADVAASLRPAPGVRIEVVCPHELAVVTNRELIEQAVANVAENAAKYTTKGHIELEARRRDNAVEIVVKDTGPGIARQEHGHLTDRFYRGDLNGAPGFGLGLSIVQSAVWALGGELHIAGKEDEGTVVYLGLPRSATLLEPA